MRKSGTSALLVALTLLLSLAAISAVWGQERIRSTHESGIYLELTEEFYRSLRDGNLEEGRQYSNQVSDEYLRQIAVSSRFMVETNLKILEQQEKIIQLLEALSIEAGQRR